MVSHWGRRSTWIALLSLTSLASFNGNNTLAQDPLSNDEQAEPNEPRNPRPPSDLAKEESAEREIDLADLPKPPEAIEKLINEGTFRFLTGGQPQSSLGSFNSRGRLAGETRFKFRYRYDSRARWSFDRSSANSNSQSPMVNIVVRFRTLKLFASHDVWLRDVPSNESFWNDRVVLHEFDHVRISSDPRVEKLFYDSAKSLERFQVPYANVAGRGGAIEGRRVQRLIEERMKDVLTRTSDMVRIRYRELDRVTEHGLRPIPDESDFSYPTKSDR